MFNSDRHLTLGDWFVFHLLMVIPVVNIIIYIILLFSGDTNPSLRSYLWLPIIIIAVFLAALLILIAIGVSLPQLGGVMLV